MKLAYCERNTAGPVSPVHIRIVGEEGLRLGGGVPNHALCCADVRGGWDLPTAVTLDTFSQWSQIPQDQPGRLCRECVNSLFGERLSVRKKWRTRSIPSFAYAYFSSQRAAYRKVGNLRELYLTHMTNIHEVHVEFDEGEGWRLFETITFPERVQTEKS